MKKYSVAIIGLSASAIAQAASLQSDIAIDKEKVNHDLVDALLSQSGLSEKDPASAINSAIVDLAKHLSYEGQPVIDVEQAILLAQHDSREAGYLYGGALNAGACYANCHSACHGSRAWR